MKVLLLSIIARLKAKALKTLLCTWTYIIYHFKSCNERLFILHNNLINWLPTFYYTNSMNGNTKYMMHMGFNKCILATLIINLHYISVQSLLKWNFWWMNKYLIPREWNKINFLFFVLGLPKEYSENATIHGISYVFSASNAIEKFIWCVIITIIKE